MGRWGAHQACAGWLHHIQLRTIVLIHYRQQQSRPHWPALGVKTPVSLKLCFQNTCGQQCEKNGLTAAEVECEPLT